MMNTVVVLRPFSYVISMRDVLLHEMPVVCHIAEELVEPPLRHIHHFTVGVLQLFYFLIIVNNVQVVWILL